MVRLNSPRPLADGDDRQSFDCGRESLNIWFHRHALANHKAGHSRVSVVVAQDSSVAGYVALSAGSICRALLPGRDRRNSPDPVPVFLIGRLAVDRGWQRKGVGGALLVYALATAKAASRQIGGFGVITHPIDDNARTFYRRADFADLPGDDQGAMILRLRDVEANGI